MWLQRGETDRLHRAVNEDEAAPTGAWSTKQAAEAATGEGEAAAGAARDEFRSSLPAAAVAVTTPDTTGAGGHGVAERIEVGAQERDVFEAAQIGRIGRRGVGELGAVGRNKGHEIS
jgi:hypothetical protein